MHRQLAPRLTRSVLPAWLALLAGCSGGGGAPAEPAAVGGVDPLAARAARLLTRATFGPTPDAIEHVQAIGAEAWIDEQLDIWPSGTMTFPLYELECYHPDGVPPCPPEVILAQLAEIDRIWWERALTAPEQLRLRVVFALSEIFVVSLENGLLHGYPMLVASFDDRLSYGAFGTFRELLENIARDPAMGTYLSVIKSRKADPEKGIHPDENFAREVMQLFTIGLVELEADGTPRLDAEGQSIPAYDQEHVEALARVFTGYNYFEHLGGWATGTLGEFLGQAPRIGDMALWFAFHDGLEKKLPGGVTIPTSTSYMADIELALDALAEHPNVGPFWSRQLIQKLVTSNPSPEYVERVAAVWADDGAGVRGNLGAVVKAILLDPEADASADGSAAAGKLREPILRATALWRAFGAEPVATGVPYPGKEVFAQEPYRAPSVFNFFAPDHTSPALAAQGLVAPELQISGHDALTRTTNFLFELVLEGNTATGSPDWLWPRIDVADVAAVAGDTDELLDVIDLRLCGGLMSAAMRTTLTDHLASLADDATDVERALEALAMTAVSPEFALQR